MRRLSFVLGFAAGCSRTIDSADSDTVAGACDETATTPLGMDEASPLGFSGTDLAALVGGYPVASGHWATVDSSADVTIHSEGLDGAVYHERSMSVGTDPTCVSTLELTGMTHVESYIPEVGGADLWPTGSVVASSLDAATATATISGDDASVPDDITGITASDYQDIVFTLSNHWAFQTGFDPAIDGTLAITATKISDQQSYTAVLLTWPG